MFKWWSVLPKFTWPEVELELDPNFFILLALFFLLLNLFCCGKIKINGLCVLFFGAEGYEWLKKEDYNDFI